jgi:ATP/maltotriose-dependent transcriptional regulator MalT
MRELPDEALMHFTTSRDLYTELGERPSIAFNIMYIARMHILTGEFETARAHINKAGDLFKTAQLPNPGWKSHIYKITSELAMAQKDILQGIGFIALATITSIRYYGLSTTLGYINRTIDQL